MTLRANFNGTDVEYRPSYKRLDEGLVVPLSGKFVQIKHWNQLGSGDNEDPYPEIIDKKSLLTLDPQGKEYDYVVMPDIWQWQLWNFLDWASHYRLPKGKIEEFYKRPGNLRTFAKSTPGSLTYVYIDLVEAHRAFTEAGSPEAGNRDVVTGRNLNNPKGYEWLFRPTGGAMLKVLRVIGTDYEVEAIDILKPPPSIEYITARPWLYFWCTQWGKYSGSTRFPQITNANKVHGYSPAGTPSLLLSKGGKFRIKKSSCVELVNGENWTPYAPL